ncbi:hypothetical protein DAI22_11g080075 [Oryza sativa Japonica Group]|nr:hypothetical protein DAI22_11g080075 [Oryza sativa Japonica Group]
MDYARSRTLSDSNFVCSAHRPLPPPHHRRPSAPFPPHNHRRRHRPSRATDPAAGGPPTPGRRPLLSFPSPQPPAPPPPLARHRSPPPDRNLRSFPSPQPPAPPPRLARHRSPPPEALPSHSPLHAASSPSRAATRAPTPPPPARPCPSPISHLSSSPFSTPPPISGSNSVAGTSSRRRACGFLRAPDHGLLGAGLSSARPPLTPSSPAPRRLHASHHVAPSLYIVNCLRSSARHQSPPLHLVNRFPRAHLSWPLQQCLPP